MNDIKSSTDLLKELSNCIRILSADAIEKAASGHPGLPLGMADVMTILAFEFLKYKPDEPKWEGRDRLILSAGHGSMLLYSFYYLAGYKDFTLDDIKSFRQFDSKTPGHPEYGAYEAIETSTGPLGQGIANAVGMAITAKKTGKKHKIYVIVGDGCLMEGIAYEALSIAGHLRLDNLIVLFDDNNITIDGDTSLTISEDHHEKLHALGWNSFKAAGHDFESIRTALQTAKFSGRPAFIACKTTIGYGAPNKSGSAAIHGSPMGKEEITGLRKNLEWKDFEEFFIPEHLLNTWRNAWKNNFSNVIENAEHKDFTYELDCKTLYEMYPNMSPEPTRSSSGKIVSYLMNLSNHL
jgi:transketolase